MKKFLTPSNFLNLLTLVTSGCLLLDSIFYFGFSQKHFYLNSKNLLIFYLAFTLFLFIFKRITISKTLNKLNKILLPLILIAASLFHYLEDTNYVNFVYTYFHINPANFLTLPLLSSFIFYLNNPKYFKKHLFFLIPLFSLIVSQVFSFSLGFRVNILSNLKAYYINYFLWLVIWIFCTSLFKKRSNSIILFLSIFSFFTLVNRFKIKYLNLFFILGDLLLVKYNSQYLSEVFFQLKILESVGIILFLLLLTYLFIFIKKKSTLINPPFKFRIILFFISGFLITYPAFFPSQFKKLLQQLKIETYVWGPIENCKNNGILFCFYDDIKNITNPPPTNYSQETINQIYSNIVSNSETLSSEKIINPNIIIILSEALWDVTQLPETKFSQDPIPNIRKDIKSTLISPTIGAATANVEFELITGFSNFFLNGVIPYSQAVRKDIPTLFTAFKDNGYQTTTIHPYFAAMYNRPQVYKNFGLDNYISMEKMDNPKYAGPFISDLTLTDEILKQYHSSTTPQFIFALSMQNHYPFETDRFSSHDIKVNTSLSADNKNILQTYTDGINLSDKAYQTLKNEIAKSDRPTIIILFGDHLPLLNPGLKLYQDANYDTSDQFKIRSTPITVWSNFDPKINITQKYLSPSFLGLEILKMAQLKPKYQFSYLQSIALTDTVLQTNITPKFTPKQLSDYELVQYDLIYGKQYSLK